MGAEPSALKEGGGGFRVFKVNTGSPACEANLEVFFDFIMEINGVKMGADQKLFTDAIQESENKRLKMSVFNIRSRTSRDVFVTPRKWNGDRAGLLGAIVRYDSVDMQNSQGIRVLDVFPNSPAQAAGLIAHKDYLLGTTEVMFRNLEELSGIIDICIGKRLLIYVYNSDMEAIREVTLTPRLDWGGEGAIGADIRSGLLHRMPAPRRPLGQAQEIPLQTANAAPAQVATSSLHAALPAAHSTPVDPAVELAMLQQRLAALQAAPPPPAELSPPAESLPLDPAAELAMLQQKLATLQASAPAATPAPAVHRAAATAPKASAPAATPTLAVQEAAATTLQASAPAATPAPAVLRAVVIAPKAPSKTPRVGDAAAPPPETLQGNGLETVPLSADEELAMLQQKLASLQAGTNSSDTASVTASRMPHVLGEPSAASTTSTAAAPQAQPEEALPANTPAAMWPTTQAAAQPAGLPVQPIAEAASPAPAHAAAAELPAAPASSVKSAMARFQGGALGDRVVSKDLDGFTAQPRAKMATTNEDPPPPVTPSFTPVQQEQQPGAMESPGMLAEASALAAAAISESQATDALVGDGSVATIAEDVAAQLQAPPLPEAALQDAGSDTPGATLKVPPTTPAHGLEAVQMDPAVALQSPSTINTSNIRGFVLAGDAALEADDDEALVPGVIFEVPVVLAA